MEDQEILLKKCQKLGLKDYFKTHKHTLKRKLTHLERDVEELTRDGSDQLPPAAASVSAHSLLMSPDDLQGIVCCYVPNLLLFYVLRRLSIVASSSFFTFK